MTNFAGVDAVTAAMPGRSYSIMIPSQTTEGAGFWTSFRLADKAPGGAGQQPAPGGEAYNSASPGALPVGYATGRTLLGRLDLFCPNYGQVMLFDMLVAMSGLSGTLLTPQGVSLPALPRYDTPDGGVEAYLEWYTITGTTARNLTVTGTALDGDPMTLDMPVAGGPTVRQMTHIPPAPGRPGWRTITQVQWDASTGTAGNFGITLLKPIRKVTVGPGIDSALDFLRVGLAEFLPDACLSAGLLASGSASGVVSGEYTVLPLTA